MNKIQPKFISLSISLPLDLSVSGGVDLIHVIGGKLMKSWRNPAGYCWMGPHCRVVWDRDVSRAAQQTQEPAQQAADEPVLVVPEGTNLPIILSTFFEFAQHASRRASMPTLLILSGFSNAW